jgi:hypothetical protein
MLETKTVTNRWTAYGQVSHDSNLFSRRHARSRQRWLILFSLDRLARVAYRLLVRAGVGRARGLALAVLRTVIVP